MNTRTSAASATTAAAMARTLSTVSYPPDVAYTGAAAGRAGAGVEARGAATGAAVDVGAGAAARGAAATGTDGAAAGAAAEAAAAGAAAWIAEGAGILIVGAAVGFGGKLMRTVSFFGWILPDSPGFGEAAGGVAPAGGTEPAPGGKFGLLSAICV